MVDTFSEDAQRTLDADDRRDRVLYSAPSKRPFIVATDVVSGARLPNLIPDAWRSRFTDLMLHAVAEEDDDRG